MFAEELSGNTSRKRQDRVRERRRQIKERQRQTVAVQKKPAGDTASRPSDVEPSDHANTASEAAGSVTTLEKVSTLTTDTTEKKSAAVANTLEQRRLRQELQRQQCCAVAIQSLYRAYKSNRVLLERERSVLKGCLVDLATLRTLVLKAGNQSEYVPPPATVSSLVRQLLFVTGTIPYRGNVEEVRVLGKEEISLADQVLRYVLLPGTMTKDSHLEPLLPWLSSPEGRIRLVRLLRLCLVVCTTRGATKDVSGSVEKFLRAVLGTTGKVPAKVVHYCSSILLPQTNAPPEISVAPRSTSHAVGASLDLIQVARNKLLFHTGHSNPIPPNAEKMRESCISKSEREHADLVFQLTLDAVLATRAESQARVLQARFVAELFTVPLLTWKTSAVSVSKLLSAAPANAILTTSVSSLRPLVISCLLESFVELHASVLSAGGVSSVLPFMDIRKTPVTNVQVMLANLVQIGRICPSINGSDSSKVDYGAGTLFFNVLATLIDAIPLGTLSTRETAVEWVSDGKSHHSPIVLSPVIIDQCKLLLVDSYIRDLFRAAIDDCALDIDRVLRTKKDSDMKDEKALAEAGTASATNLAAKEAKVDRSKGFWQTSKWARKLSTSMGKMLAGDSKTGKGTSSKSKGPGQLANTSSVAMKLASGEGQKNRRIMGDASVSGKDKSEKEGSFSTNYSSEFLIALSRAYGMVLARWGGGGSDIMKRSGGKLTGEEDNKNRASATADPCTLALLNAICFSTNIVKATWSIIQSEKSIAADIFSLVNSEESGSEVQSTSILPDFSDCKRARDRQGNGVVLLYLFVCSLSHILIITDDVEIHDLDQPMPIHQLRRCIRLLKKLLYRACYVDADHLSATADTSRESNYFGLALISSSSRTMRDLYDRSSRRPLCIPKMWTVNDLLEKELRRCKSHQSYVALLSNPVLMVCPFLVSFKRRLKLFERIVATNRLEVQGSSDFFSQKPGIPVRIVRGRVLEDGLLTLNKLGPNLRERIIVQYVNEAGAREIGVDAGGLFKEFWTDLSELAFNPNYALFRVTEGAGSCLYPNPSSSAAHGPDHITLFEFLGRILGKALYEGITIHPQFAHVFLSFLRGDYNYLHMLPDLSTMDPQLYNNLMFLKTYDGDARDLCLTFTVATTDFGDNVEVPLIPNGADIEVTNDNKQRYIGLVAKHHVCDRLRAQSMAFTRGLWDVIDREWICLFNEPELQVLISGSSDGKIDIADMRSNTKYVGGYTGLDRNINRFWTVVSSFSSKQQGDLLRFVTSCERPPPLGFASMNPPFTIQRVGILRDGDKLPTASTCFNTLKLPTYSSEKVLRERLLYAIESGAGFELT